MLYLSVYESVYYFTSSHQFQTSTLLTKLQQLYTSNTFVVFVSICVFYYSDLCVAPYPLVLVNTLNCGQSAA